MEIKEIEDSINRGDKDVFYLFPDGSGTVITLQITKLKHVLKDGEREYYYLYAVDSNGFNHTFFKEQKAIIGETHRMTLPS